MTPLYTKSVSLRSRRWMSLDGSLGDEIRCRTGQLRITRAADSLDVTLSPGQWLTLDGRGTYYAQGHRAIATTTDGLRCRKLSWFASLVESIGSSRSMQGYLASVAARHPAIE